MVREKEDEFTLSSKNIRRSAAKPVIAKIVSPGISLYPAGNPFRLNL